MLKLGTISKWNHSICIPSRNYRLNYGRGKGNELNLPSFEEGRVIARGFVSPNLEFPVLVHTSQIPAYNIYYVNFHEGGAWDEDGCVAR